MAGHFIPIVLLLACSMFVFVYSYTVFVPKTDTMTRSTDLEYDETKQGSQPVVEGTYHTMLSKLLINYLNSIQGKDYVGRSIDKSGWPYYRPIQENGRSKRKVFWQPLGYLPAGASLSAESGSSSNNGKGNLFRYG